MTSKSVASVFLTDALAALDNRGQIRDKEGGERSMARTVDAFNTLTGAKLTETEGWLFMAVLKLARATAGRQFHRDDYVDLAGYAGLAGESAAKESFARMVAIEPYHGGLPCYHDYVHDSRCAECGVVLDAAHD